MISLFTLAMQVVIIIIVAANAYMSFKVTSNLLETVQHQQEAINALELRLESLERHAVVWGDQ